MRWIFLILLAINLSVLGYFWMQPEQPKTTENDRVELESPGKRLVLLSEAGDLVTRPADNLTAALMTECYKLGPFDEERRYRQAESRAQALGVEFDEILVTVASDKPVEYWVYVPARKTRAEAEKVLAELKRRRVDSFLVGRGEMENAISLGLFRVRASADRIANQVKSYKIPVEIEVKNEDAAQRWLEVRIGAGLTPEMRDQISGRAPGVSWAKQTCQNF